MSYILPYFSKNEINQLVSMFQFHNNIFSTYLGNNLETYLTISNDNISLNTDLFCFEFSTDMDDDILINIGHYTEFFETCWYPEIITIHDIQCMIANQLKTSASRYFNKEIKVINNEIMNKIINETFADCQYRLNNKGLYIKSHYQEICKNIYDSKLDYKLLLNVDYNKIINVENKLKNHDIIIIKDNSDLGKETIDQLYFGFVSSIFIDKPNIIRKVLKNIFNDDDISFILSIISLFDFIEKIKKPSSKECLVTLWTNSDYYQSKDEIIHTPSALGFIVNDFRLNIGRSIEVNHKTLENTGIDYNGEPTYAEKTNYKYIADNFENIYINLVNLLEKKLIKSLDVSKENLTWDHIKLQQMKNY
jgi:hypothetical protein